MYRQSFKKGFTFIELLVAFSIIGVLMTIVFAGASATRKSARVAQRVSEMKKVQSALDLYYAKYKAYPSTLPWWGGATGGWRSVCNTWKGTGQDQVTSANDVIKDLPTGRLLVPDYIASMSNDPQMDAVNSTSCYLYKSDGADYAFLDHQVTELASGPGATYAKYPELYDYHRDGGQNVNILDGSNFWAWKVSSPGAISW